MLCLFNLFRNYCNFKKNVGVNLKIQKFNFFCRLIWYNENYWCIDIYYLKFRNSSYRDLNLIFFDICYLKAAHIHIKLNMKISKTDSLIFKLITWKSHL